MDTPETQSGGSLKPVGSVPDKPGFWWFKPVGDTRWEMVEARDIMNRHICLYATSGKWGGCTLQLAVECLKGEWVYVPTPNGPAERTAGH
jgi:hypothetical protein